MAQAHSCLPFVEEIALCTPSLWSDIRITKLDYKWASKMLQRSQQNTLTAHVNFDDLSRRTRRCASIDRAFTMLADNVGRCRDLSLYNVEPEPFGRFLTPNHNASQLLVLQLSVGCPFFGVDEDNQFILSDRNLRADALKHLTLIACPLDWNSTFLHRLTHLKIASASNTHSEALNFLRVLPQVTSLCQPA